MTPRGERVAEGFGWLMVGACTVTLLIGCWALVRHLLVLGCQ
jgi:hypothetical protein